MSVYVNTCVQGNPLAWAHMPTWMHINKAGQLHKSAWAIQICVVSNGPCS